MKRGSLWIVFAALCALVSAGCSSHHHVVNEIQVTITTAPTTLAVGATSNVAATVVNDSANGGVTWNCTPSDFCSANNFNPTQTASGATSVFTAPTTAGTATITATSVTDPTVASTPVNITITNGTVTASSLFSFYVTGEESNGNAGDPYVIAGSVGFGPDGLTVVSGEQDYNDADTITSPQPGGDVITGGSLTMGSDGNATLTLFTNNPNVGNPAGTETFALAFANTNHAQIIQFDGSATSSGSYDLQTLPQTPSGSFSFVFSGADRNGAFSSGGIFTITGGTSISGTIDTNQGGTVTPGASFTATLTAPDSFGRGNVSNPSESSFTGNYYIVGPEVIRLIDVNTTNLGVGSAYGQGSGSFSTPCTGLPCVFYISDNVDSYAAVGQFTTSSNNFNGVGDYNFLTLDDGAQTAQTFSGTYTLNSSGYGAMTFNEGFGAIGVLGIYAVDPTLNINDPNDTTDPTVGGALVAEMDANLAGTGVLVPQTDTTASDFTGNYTFGAQGETDADLDEFDFVGEANVTGSTFTGNGNLSDPFGLFTGLAGEFTDLTVNGTVTADGDNPGRLTFSTFTLASNQAGLSGSEGNASVTVYQAGTDQLFWIDTDTDDYFGGYLQQSTIAEDAAKPAKKAASKKK